jgi:hypothetical protein
MVSLTPQLLFNLNFGRHLRLCLLPSLSYALFYIHFIATTGGAGGIGVADCVGTTAGSKYQGNFNLPCLVFPITQLYGLFSSHMTSYCTPHSPSTIRG